MTRSIYRVLLYLHPRSFRRHFAAEMLWIFDEAVAQEGAYRLIFDGFISLVRQWVIGCGAWKVLAGALGAMIQLVLVGLVLYFTGAPLKSNRVSVANNLSQYDLEFSRSLAVVMFVLVVSTAILCVRSRRRLRG